MNKNQIMLVQIAAKQAGLRGKGGDGRYRLLLAKYRRPNGEAVDSCKQLNRYQMEDFLAICESLGFHHKDKPANYHRNKVARWANLASFAQQEAIKHLSKDLGWDRQNLNSFIVRMTGGKETSLCDLTPTNAGKIIEGLKAMVSRDKNKQYSTLNEIKDDYLKEPTDGKTCQSQ